MSKSAKQTAAETAKVEAEAAQATAYAEKARAEAAKLKAEASSARAAAKIMRLRLEDEQRDEEQRCATDEANLVLRFGESVTDRSVKGAIHKMQQWSRLNPGDPIEVVFTSPGGSIFDGMALFDFLRTLSRDGHHVTTGCLGWAASMAGILLQAGDTRWMGKESLVMIHRAAFGVHGQTFEVEDEVEFVKRIEDRIVDIFVARSDGKLNGKYLRKQWERRDWWLFSDEALKLGVVDEVR